MTAKNQPLSSKKNIVVQEIDNEVLIYDLGKNKAFCLNETSALVWEMCDGKIAISEMSEIVSKKLNSSIGEEVVWLALDQLKKFELIDSETDVPNDYHGMSRREVIKKIGLTSMIALPVVASIVAPTAAMAASCGGTLIPGFSPLLINYGPGISGCATFCSDAICQMTYGNDCLNCTATFTSCDETGSPSGTVQCVCMCAA